jgi:succinate dehydrogenase / fumarate reductase membrane anchor subunit
MTLQRKDYRTPLRRTRGLGSAHEGVHHWTLQRMSAIALVPLTLWFAWSVITLVDADYQAYHDWIAEHGNAMMLILFVIGLFYHVQLGLQVVIEDYVHSEVAKYASIVAVKLAAVFFAVSNIMAIMRITFAG